MAKYQRSPTSSQQLIRKDKHHLADEETSSLLETLDASDYEEEEDSSVENLVVDCDVNLSISGYDNDFSDSSDGSDADESDNVPDEAENTSKPIAKTSCSKWIEKAFRFQDQKWLHNLKQPEYAELPTPFTFFSQYYDNEFFEAVAYFTNLYSSQKHTTNIKTDTKEIRELVSIHILMGVLKFPRMAMYWSKATRIPSIADVIERHRFSKLRQCLHVVNNLESQSDINRLWKVQPLIDKFLLRCRSLPLQENLSIDEQIIPFKGKLNIKQYVKNKPSPWGIKVYLLCGENGMVYNAIVYQGKTTDLSLEDCHALGQGGAVVNVLLDVIPKHQNFKVFFDNYFMSIPLLKSLKQRGYLSAGTIRKNRAERCPLPSKKVQKTMQKGESQEYVCENDGVVIVSWMENKLVALASNFVGIGKEKATRWDTKGKQYFEVRRPEIVQQYNQAMGGIDKTDQMISFYRVPLRCRKWALSFFFHFIEMALFNSWLEYKEVAKRLQTSPKRILQYLDFKLEVAHSLQKAGLGLETMKRGAPETQEPSDTSLPEKRHKKAPQGLPTNDIRFDGIGHWPIIESERSQRCRIRNCQGKTRFQCEKCKVYLCLVRERNCFISYHTMV